MLHHLVKLKSNFRSPTVACNWNLSASPAGGGDDHYLIFAGSAGELALAWKLHKP
jgi:hypothetical protein